MNRFPSAFAIAIVLALACISLVPVVSAAENVSTGTVLAVEASANPDARFGSSNAGAVLGGALGGALGYKSGNGSHRYLAGTAGTAIGAYLGNRVDNRRRGNATYSIVVQLENGQVVAVVDPRPSVSVGSRVYLIGGNRVVPARAQSAWMARRSTP